jgi:hypothetical protein
MWLLAAIFRQVCTALYALPKNRKEFVRYLYELSFLVCGFENNHCRVR